ncbi:MAG: extracellular solute-binding protein [Victivallales bacterium]|nr:extracellular solute-binding protein [Victivallales bacterium]
MSTRLTIATLLLVLSIITGAAIMMIPPKDHSGKIHLSWATDACPERDHQVSTFNRLNPDYDLQIDPDNSGVMKVIIQSSAGMGPDLIDHINQTSIQTYAEAGILWDISKEADRLGFGLDTLPESIKPLVTMTTVNQDGELVTGQAGYPCNMGYKTLFFNKNLFDKYNVPYPSLDLTWDEYIELGKKMTISDPERPTVPAIFGAAGLQPQIIAMSKGGEYFNSWGTVTQVDSDEFITAFCMYHDMMYKHIIEPSPNQKAGVSSQGGWGSGYITWFGEGKVAMYWGSRWIMVQLRRNILQQISVRETWLKNNPGANPNDAPEVLRLGCVQIPRFKGHKRIVPNYAKCTGINVNSPRRESALKFLAYLAGKEYSMIINQGGDGLPGNKKYNKDLSLLINPKFPGEEEVHKAELEAIPYGKVMRSSPFVNNATVDRIMKKVTEKLVACPEMTHEEIAAELHSANLELNTIIARNIKRESKLFKLYHKILKNGAAPITIDLNKI